MSEFLPLRITRSNAGHGDSSARVLLEQEPWDPYVGMLTKGGVVAYLRYLLFGGDEQPESCGADVDGVTSGLVYAYPDPPRLSYHLGISHGQLGLPTVTEVLYSEVLQIQLERFPTLRYPTSEIVSAVWVTDAFAGDGESLPRPAISTAGGRIAIAEAVYGTILAIYKVTRHTYRVNISPRPTAAENKYQSFVYAVWDGGNNFIEYKPPADAEDGGRCNNMLRRIEAEFGLDECEPPSASPEDLNYDVDYCSGEVSS